MSPRTGAGASAGLGRVARRKDGKHPHEIADGETNGKQMEKMEKMEQMEQMEKMETMEQMENMNPPKKKRWENKWRTNMKWPN